MNSFNNHLKALDLIYPNPIIPKANFLGGCIIITLSFFSLLLALSISPVFQIFWIDINSGNFLQSWHDLTSYFLLRSNASSYDNVRFFCLIVTISIFTPAYIHFAFSTLKFGLKRIGAAFLDWRNTGIPENVPTDISKQHDVLRRMIRREKYSNDMKPGKETAIFGLNAQMISPAATGMAQPNADYISSLVGQLVLRISLGLAIGAMIWWINWLPALGGSILRAFQQIIQSAGLWPSLIETLLPFAWMIFIIIATAFADYFFVRMLIPKRSWPAESQSLGERVVAATPPNLISEEFPSRMERYRMYYEPNRIYALVREAAAASVNETGNFAFSGLIEQNPTSIENPNLKAACLRLLCGWGLFLLGTGVLLFFLMPSALRAAVLSQRLPDAVHALAPIAQVGYIFVGRRALREARRMIGEAEALFETYWFESCALAFQIRGTTSRSEVNIGRSQTDSIHTSSTVYRSEFLYDLTTSVLISESIHLSGARNLVGMRNTDQSSALLHSAENELKAIIDTRAAPIKIDLGDHGLREHVEINTMIEAIRTAQTDAARRQARQGGDIRGLKPNIQGRDQLRRPKEE